MEKGRLEAFSDGVLAIVITIMVLEIKVPHGSSFQELAPLWPKFLSYLLSFLYVAIYWNNHHHLFRAVEKIHGNTLWHNAHLLFWLSLLPFATGWAGENHFETGPMAVYGFVLLMAATAYFFLVKDLLSHHEEDSPLRRAVGKDTKGKISMVVYVVAIALAFWSPLASGLCYVAVALTWFLPDRRIEEKAHELPQG